MPRRVAVMHHMNSFFPLELRARVGSCAELVWVVDSPSISNEMLRFVRRLGPVIDTAGRDLDSVAYELTRAGVEGVVSFVDDHIVDAALVAERLGLPYHLPQVARALVNKQVQRAALDAAGIPGPEFWSAPSGLDATQAAAFADQVTYPAVVKPAQGSGSRDISLVHNAEDLVTVMTAAEGPGYLVEQYLEDERGHDSWYASYLSVESVVSHGTIGHVALTGRFPLADPFRETGNFIPAICPPDQVPELLTMVDDTIAALGITDSVTHTEIKLTPEGPRLIEVNGRLGGRPPFVLSGISDTNLFQVACQVALGETVRIDSMTPCDGVGLLAHAPCPHGGPSGGGGGGHRDGLHAARHHRRAGGPSSRRRARLAGRDRWQGRDDSGRRSGSRRPCVDRRPTPRHHHDLHRRRHEPRTVRHGSSRRSCQHSGDSREHERRSSVDRRLAGRPKLKGHPWIS